MGLDKYIGYIFLSRDALEPYIYAANIVTSVSFSGSLLQFKSMERSFNMDFVLYSLRPVRAPPLLGHQGDYLRKKSQN